MQKREWSKPRAKELVILNTESMDEDLLSAGAAGALIYLLKGGNYRSILRS